MSFMTRTFQEFRRTLSGEHNKVFAAARPHDPLDYARPELDGSGPVASDFPLGKTQPGASLDEWPDRVMAGCTEPLPPGVPDLGGVWEVYEGRMKGHVERIEQAGNRICITTCGPLTPSPSTKRSSDSADSVIAVIATSAGVRVPAWCPA